MSLDSYKKALESQREQECKESTPNLVAPNKRKRRKTGNNKIIIAVVIIAVLLLAAFKNPSKVEAKEEIKSLFTEIINEQLRHQITDENNSTGKQIGSALAMLIAPTFIDKWVQPDISDYILFSTFDASVTFQDKKKTLASGIIIFGKVIPLKTDIKKEYFE